MNKYHKPVMLDEALSWLDVKPGKKFVDVTLGGGGHAEKILEATSPDGMLIGIDQDSDAVLAASRELKKYGDRVQIVKARMSEIASFVKEADGVLADLGVSSFQLDEVSRGFSFRNDAPLDMRMNRELGETASELIARLDEMELEKILREFGEERFARSISRAICRKKDIKTTLELAEIVKSAVPVSARYGRIHPATRTFQAVRIAVNDELYELSRFLDVAPKVLASKGRLVVISYHSLEDRMVKRAFKAMCETEKYVLPIRRVQVADEQEVAENVRSRSAKLRVLERI